MSTLAARLQQHARIRRELRHVIAFLREDFLQEHYPGEDWCTDLGTYEATTSSGDPITWTLTLEEIRAMPEWRALTQQCQARRLKPTLREVYQTCRACLGMATIGEIHVNHTPVNRAYQLDLSWGLEHGTSFLIAPTQEDQFPWVPKDYAVIEAAQVTLELLID